MIRKISVDLTTTFAKGAGTRGRVYLGLGGREFCCDIDDHPDFEQGSETTYEFGEEANVLFPERNDPRVGQALSFDDAVSRPVYIRLDGKDDWQVGFARVRVVSGADSAVFTALDGPQDHAWLGPQSGFVIHLRRSQ